MRGAPEGEGGGMKGAGVSRAGLSSAQWVGREAPAEQPGPRTMPQMSPLVRESCNKGRSPGRAATGWALELEIQMKVSTRRLAIMEKAPTSSAFSWLKVATTAFTFKTLLRHYAKQALTPRSLNVKLGP